jgi:hypothetical protein
MNPPNLNPVSGVRDGEGEPAMVLGLFGHHPDPEIDFCIEVEALEGEAYEVSVGLISQWPFWAAYHRPWAVAARTAGSISRTWSPSCAASKPRPPANDRAS